MSYVPFNVHSQYSILDSTASVTELAEKAKSFGIPALALTDSGNLYGAVDFYKACKSAGIKPILGCELWVAPTSRLEKKKGPVGTNGYSIILIAKNNLGYRHLCKLSSIAFLEGFYYQPRIDKEVLAKYKEGLVCLSHELSDWEWFYRLFEGDFYFEMQRHPLGQETIDESWLVQKRENYVALQKQNNEKITELSEKHSVPVIATNGIHYIEQPDWKAHEILLNVQSGEPCEIWERDSFGNPKTKVANPKREVAPTRESYFKSPEEMRALFADIPKAIDNTLMLAEKCSCELDFKTRHYPVFTPPNGKPKEEFLYDLCQQGIARRYTPSQLEIVARTFPGKDPVQVVNERLEYEFSVITSKGMTDYMLIVYDFISWAKGRKIPVGPGRGSAAGSIISYLIGITDIEPLRFHLFFERFINPERISYPDIDVDICMERRQEVIDYVVAKYGKDKVAQIITFGTMKAKMAIRDVGRVLNVPLSKVNEIASLVPEDPTMTLEKAFQIDPGLQKLMDTDAEAKAVLEMARKAEGSIRNTSTHAAGLIISAGPITDYIPVCTAKDSQMVVTQFAMKPVEMVGMLKIDFLGLKTLTSIQKCADAIESASGQKIDWVNLPLDDRATYDLLNHGKTLGIFQLESGGMQDLAKQLHIDTFEEVIAVGALYRPGPMDMIPSFINRKHGKEAIEIDHPLMKEILAETYGVMVYQEQVIQIASALAGYSLGEGDMLRRAMGKKDRDEMMRQREKFIKGCQQKDIDGITAAHIFDKIEKFASYGFNKAHAAAYAYLSYATAYFKANYTKEWLAALMTCDRDDTSKLAKFIGEAKAFQIDVLPPDINTASSQFVASMEGIRFAMSGIKGLGIGIVEMILEERNRKGVFLSLYDFIQRVDKNRIGKKAIELLVDAGSFDFTKWTRDSLRESVEAMYELAAHEQKEKEAGILDLFALIDDQKKTFQEPPVVIQKSTPFQLFQREKELLGFYLTGHPMDQYKKTLEKLQCIPLADVEKLSEGALFRTAFVIEAIQLKVSSKTQKKFAILTISDGMERFELPIWSEMYEEKVALLKENQLIFAILQTEKREGALQLACKMIEDLVSLDEEKIKRFNEDFEKIKGQGKRVKTGPVEKEEIKTVVLKLDANKVKLSHILELKDVFRANPGKSPVELHFMAGQQKVGAVVIGSDWGVKAGLEIGGKDWLL